MRSEQTLAKPVLQRRKDLPLYHLRCFKAVLKCSPPSVHVLPGRSLALHFARSLAFGINIFWSLVSVLRPVYFVIMSSDWSLGRPR